MRILTVEPGPAFSVADVHRGWRDALAKHADVADVNVSNRIAFYANAQWEEGQSLGVDEVVHLVSEGIKAKCYEWWPDVIVVTSAFFVHDSLYELWRQRPHRLVLIFTESPYEDDRQLEKVALADPDLVIVNDPTHIDKFRELCPATFYIPHAYDPTVHYPRTPTPELISDFALCGTGYPSRVQLLEQVCWDGLDVKFAGMWLNTPERSPLRKFVIHPLEECFDNKYVPDLYSSTKTSLNLYRKEANDVSLVDGWAMGPREVELAACGTFFVREPRGESDLTFPMLPTFTDARELEDLIRWYVDHDELRIEAACKARAAIAERTFDNHAALMLQLLEQHERSQT